MRWVLIALGLLMMLGGAGAGVAYIVLDSEDLLPGWYVLAGGAFTVCVGLMLSRQSRAATRARERSRAEREAARVRSNGGESPDAT